MSYDTLLMTSAIQVSKKLDFHLHVDSNIRIKQYINALIFYITQSNIKFIVFCDGSNYCLDKELGFITRLAKIYNKEIEFISFKQDIELVNRKGKGYGENSIIEYATTHSNLLKTNESFYKVTGRYIVKNINTIISDNIDKENVFCKVNPFQRYGCNTAFFKCSKSFFKNVLLGAGEFVQDHQGHYLEHEYMKRIKGLSIGCFNRLPEFSGIAGGGREINQSKLKTIIKGLCNLIGLYKI